MRRSLAEQLLPKRMLDELGRVLYAHNGQRANEGNGVVSIATRRERRQVILLSFAQLWQLGYRLKSPQSLGERHIRVLVKRWDQEELAAGTIHTRISYLSTFSGWIGKAGMAGRPMDYCDKARIARVYIAESNKAWRPNGISPEEVIARAKEIDARLALYLTLQHTLGLRVKESIEFRPALSLADDGVTLEIFEGTKGGRRRIVRIETEAQREAMGWALEVGKASSNGRLRWPGMTFRKAKGRFYYLLSSKLGINRRETGVTAHGLRHGFAHEHYHRQTGGLLTPVEGGALGRVDRETHNKASLSGSRALGHSRLSVTGAYYGSYGHALRTAQPPPMHEMGKVTITITPMARMT